MAKKSKSNKNKTIIINEASFPTGYKGRYVNEEKLPAQDTSFVFSFRFLKEKPKKFTYTKQGRKYFIALIERLKELSENITFENLHSVKDSTRRFHSINWSSPKVSENTFGLEPEYDDEAFQFSTSTTNGWRIHGFILNKVFYIVWLDSNHKLYPR